MYLFKTGVERIVGHALIVPPLQQPGVEWSASEAFELYKEPFSQHAVPCQDHIFFCNFSLKKRKEKADSSCAAEDKKGRDGAGSDGWLQ